MRFKEAIYKVIFVFLQIILFGILVSLVPSGGILELKKKFLIVFLILIIALIFYRNNRFLSLLYLGGFSFIYMLITALELEIISSVYTNIIVLIFISLVYFSGPFVFLKSINVSKRLPFLFILLPFLAFYIIISYSYDSKILIGYSIMSLMVNFIQIIFIEKKLSAISLSEVFTSFFVMKFASLDFDISFFVESIILAVISIIYYIFDTKTGSNYNRAKILLLLLPIVINFNFLNAMMVFYLLLCLCILRIFGIYLEMIVSNIVNFFDFNWNKKIISIKDFDLINIKIINSDLTVSLASIFVIVGIFFMWLS